MTELAGSFALKVSVMMRGGMGQHRALEQLSHENDELGEAAGRILQRLRLGMGAGESIAAEATAHGEAWKLLGSTWAIAEHSGAPIATSLDRMSRAFFKVVSLGKRRSVLLAGPKGTVLLISALPIVAFIVGELMGVRVADQLLTMPGMLLGVVGILLLILGLAWSFAMIRGVNERDEVAGFELDLLWIALAGGAPLEHAQLIVVNTTDLLDAHWVNLESFGEAGAATVLLKQAIQSGMPLRDLVLVESDTLREEAHSALEKEAERLAIRVLIPLGVCVLPSFICIGVIPIMLGMLV